MTIKAKPTSPCSAESATASVKRWAGRLFTKNRRTAYPATRYGPKTATNSKSSKNGPSRASSIFCWCSCLTASGVSLTKRPLWWNGLSRTASGYGVPKQGCRWPGYFGTKCPKDYISMMRISFSFACAKRMV